MTGTQLDPSRKREARFDRLTLTITGCAAAAFAIGAVAMSLSPQRRPQIWGLEHFGIFGKPAALLAQRLAREEAPVGDAALFAAPAARSPRLDGAAATAPSRRAPSSDMTAVGALQGDRATPLASWKVQDLIGDRVLLVGPGGVRWARAGDDLGAAGVVRSIEIERRGVAVVTSKGRIGPGS
jgi:hypothetical protein